MRKLNPAFAAHLAQRYLEPGDSVLDVGAADGEYTAIYAERVGPAGEVLAVEPSERTRTIGEAACPPWVRWVPCAVGAKPGTATFYLPRRLPKTASLYERNVRKSTRTHVDVRTLDDLVASMRQTPALIQIDAQGAELAILRGATRTLALPCVWVVEVWPAGLFHAGATVDRLLALFRRGGYLPESPSGRSMVWTDVDREVQRVGPAPHGHFDLVLVPAALQVAVSA